MAQYAAENHGVTFLPGTKCQLQQKYRPAEEEEEKVSLRDPLTRWMRLCFAMMSEEDLVDGVKRLKEACKQATTLPSPPVTTMK